MTDLYSFTLFPSLPPELRIRVWELSIEPRIVREGCHFHGMRRAAKSPHQLPPPIFRVNWESRAVALKEYEPFMGTFLHLRLDTLSIQGLYFDYLGPDMVALNDLGQRLSAQPKMTLRSPFHQVHVIFTGPWSTGCDCHSANHTATFIAPRTNASMLELAERTREIQIT